MAHFRADGEDLTEGTGVLRRHGLQLTPHTNGGTQHRHRTGQDPFAVFAFKVDRGDFQHEVLAVNHHMLAMRLLRAALQPALDVKIGN